MAAGQARQAMHSDPRRVQIVDRNGAPRWHPVWENNPRIARPGEPGDFQQVRNGPGLRPYILAKTGRQWTWQPYSPTPGELVFSPAEQAWAAAQPAPQVVIEPTLKARASPNKLWTGWREFIQRAEAAGIELTQLAPPGTAQPRGVRLIHTPDFRHAAAVLARARIYVGHEGGLHHAAAALGLPAVVIFGGFIGPQHTGYAGHRNLAAGGEPCGMRVPCRHCLEAMNAITPQGVMKHMKELLDAQ